MEGDNDGVKNFSVEEIKKKFGENLSTLRLKKRLTRKDLGMFLGVSEVTIGGYENGNRQPSFSMLFRLANFFGVSIDELLGHEDFQDSVLLEYRLHHAEGLLYNVGIIYPSHTGEYILIVKKEEKFETDNNGVVKRVDEGDDLICFGDKKSLIEFAEYIERQAIFSDKTFESIFKEQSEKLFADEKSVEKGKKILADYENSYGLINFGTRKIARR